MTEDIDDWTRVLALLVVLAVPAGCVVRRTIEIEPTSSTPRICADGKPVKILQHPDCTGGICGYTCEPNRWKEPIAVTGSVFARK